MLSTRTSIISAFVVLLMLISAGFGMYISWNYSGGSQDSFEPDSSPVISEERPVNVVVTGNANLTISYLGSDNEAKSIGKDTILFGNQWTPGHNEVVYLTITNNGENNVNYSVGVNVNSETGSVNIAGEEFKLSDHLMFGFAEEFDPAGETDIVEALSSSEKVSSGVSKSGTLTAEQNSVTLALVVYLPESSAEAISVAAGQQMPEISLGLSLLATQPMGGNNFVELPELPEGFIASTTVTDVVTDGVLSSTVTIGDGQSMGAVLPEGVKIAEGATDVTLNVAGTSRSSNIDMNFGQLSRSLDVHIDGIADDNDVPMAIYLGAILPIGYNTANIALYHVENGEAIKMELVEEFTAHNQYIYNAETGEVIIYIASFSEVTAVINDGDPWQGDRDYDWYNKPVTETIDGTEYTVYYISTAEELAGFGAIVGGMDGKTADNFAGKVVKLKNSISIGDLTDEDGRDVVFYPIGYYNSDGHYVKSNQAITSGFRNFEGTFDGQGYTISDWYQNTWEMKGDHNWYDASLQYYRDGMGLFGRVYGGTIKNLVVNNFSSDGEITTTGVIAAYADCGAKFENIQIYNCNPRVYNIGNGGIVGCVGWYAKEADTKVYFKNITVDDSNKISALWGSWDVSCGGIVGQYYAISGQTSAGKPVNGGIVMENCDVAAEIDVFNDVCGNYQYYQYRYAGMLIGTVGQNSDPSEDAKKIEFNNCRVRYGDWAEYYYCELVENTQASYTHDHQMSRLTKIYNLNEIKSGDNWLKTGDFVLIEGETKTCYHIRKDANGFYQHSHTDYNRDGEPDYQVVDGESVLVEDKQVVHITFKQLYTGYGWGATPMHGDTTIVEYLYSIKYIHNGEVLYTDYVKDNSKDYSTNSKDEAKAAASKAESEMNGRDDGKTYKFAYWMNAGSTKIESVKAGNRENIVLYPSFEGVYTAMFVDQQGNVIGWDTFTKGNGSNIGNMGNSIVPPTIDGFQFSYWEVHITDDKGKTDNKGKLSDYKFQDETDISIYPIYIYKGEAALKPVDIDGDGDTDYYEVTGFTDGKGVEVVEIPNIVNGKPVTTINTDAFSSYDDLYSVRIPANITSINYQSFSADNPNKWGENRDTVTLYYEGNPDKWKQYMDVFYKSNNKYNDYNYGGTAPTYPQDATTIFQSGWDHMMGDGSRVFFIGENGIVDTSLGYWELYVEGKNFLGQGGTYTWIYHKHEYDHNNKCSEGHKASGEVENYLEKKNNEYTRPDYTYWTTERNPEDQ